MHSTFRVNALRGKLAATTVLFACRVQSEAAFSKYKKEKLAGSNTKRNCFKVFL